MRHSEELGAQLREATIGLRHAFDVWTAEPLGRERRLRDWKPRVTGTCWSCMDRRLLSENKDCQKTWSRP